MIEPLSAVKEQFKVDHRKVSIDDIVFKCHYRVTVILLIVCTILVTQRQYIGEHIKCITDSGVPEAVINTFCFFSSTYTAVKHLNESLLKDGHIPHPGVGPSLESDEVIHHAYYQWVPFVLSLQAISFYMPHYLWKSIEGGRLRKLVSGLKLYFFDYYKEDQTDENLKIFIPSHDNALKQIEELKAEFVDRLHTYNAWSRWLIICEILNLVNLIVQVVLTNIFLGGSFMSIGPEVWNNPDWDAYLDPLDIVFPKVTKCLFYKYGPSGTIQKHDALCVMALNVIHEKIYTILWFWYAILFIFTVTGLIIRLISFILHSRSRRFNETMLSYACPGKLDIKNLTTVTHESNFGDWLFLYFLAKNMNSFTFRNFFEKVAEHMESKNTKSRKQPNLSVMPATFEETETLQIEKDI